MKNEKEVQEEIDRIVQNLITVTGNLRLINNMQARLRSLFWVLEKTKPPAKRLL